MNEKSPGLAEVERQGQNRLHPSLTNPNWLVLRERRKIFSRWMAELPSDGLCVLDLGGRIQPYRPLIAGRVCEYIAVDLRLTPLVSVVARGEQLPLRDARFDLVICTQVLEYAQEPSCILSEVHRVLKPGGKFLLSVPSASVVDAEEECWRFLPAGLRHLLAAFRSVEVRAEGSSVSGVFRAANACADIFVRYRSARFLYRHTLCPLVNLSGALLEGLSGRRNEQFTANYSVLAEK